MAHSIAAVTLVVRDYDEAIPFFTRALRFALIEDISLGEGKRRARVTPPGATGATLLLAQASTLKQQRR